jgi:lysozyme family protein
MAAVNWDQSIKLVLISEGGNDDDPIDPGGRTSRGIIQREWNRYRATHPGLPADVWQAPQSAVLDIYRRDYWDVMRGDDLPAGFDYSVFDACVNSGAGRAPIWAGKALGASVRGMGDVVPLANAAPDKVALIQKYWSVRLSFLHGLRTWGHFGGGWGRRCAQGEAAAVRMWLSVGRGLSSTDAKTRMDKESAKAKTKAKQAGTGAATTGATTTAAPTLDPMHMSLGGKIALGMGIAFAIVLVVYLVRQVIIHNQRATAYAAS